MGYWEERTAETQTRLAGKSIREAEEQLEKYYHRTMVRILGQFEKTYNKLLSTIKEGETPTTADLYKLDKYWQMQGALKEELQKLGDRQAAYLSNKFMTEYKEIYEAIALKDDIYFSELNTGTAEQVINQIWCADGKSWSQRIWQNTDMLQQALNDNLIDCVVAGRKPAELKKMLMQDFAVSFKRADTIVRTEVAHIQTQAARQRYIDYGCKEVQVLVSPDERTCPICGALDGKRFPIGGKMPVPAHPRCRCCIIPVVERRKKNKDFLQEQS